MIGPLMSGQPIGRELQTTYAMQEAWVVHLCHASCMSHSLLSVRRLCSQCMLAEEQLLQHLSLAYSRQSYECVS